MYYSEAYPSPVGTITLACDENNLVGLWIENQKYYGGAIAKKVVEKKDMTILNTAKEWLDQYFAGNRPNLSALPLAPMGTDFRQSVWEILCKIPYGQVITYGDIAKEMALKMNRKSMSGQAVGGAVGHNPISIIIPCHRVVGAKGTLTGYAAGVDVKIKLLELEGVTLLNHKAVSQIHSNIN